MAPPTRRCTECGTAHANTRPDCDPLAKHRGPDVTSPDHPSNNRAWTSGR